MRFHILGLAHTQTNRDYMPCAYTQKVLKLCRMLTGLGHEVVHYGAEGSAVPCEHVTVVSDDVQRATYGDYNWRREFFRHDPNDLAYRTFNENAVQKIKARARPDDFLLVSFGNYQKPVADGVNLPLTVEMGIGYSGVFAPFQVYESYAWMSYVYGLQGRSPRWYDAVIPNYYDPSDFQVRERRAGYLAYLGRLTPEKGVQIAIDVARELDRTLVVAGQGDLSQFNTSGVRVVYLGTVDARRRKILLGHAGAVLVPSQYLEPFGGAAVEAQLCGAPVITTDWGAFPETVQHGVTGYRCRTFDDFLFAAQQAHELDPKTIRRWAEDNYSLERVGGMYQEYFGKLYDLHGDGWYTRRTRVSLDWLRKR